MRILILFVAALAVSCSSVAPVKKPIPHLAHKAPEQIASPQIDVTPAISPRLVSEEIHGIRFDGMTFDSRAYQLLVADQPNGPDSQFADSAHAAQSMEGIAAINAGFFTPEGKPLGLVMSSGKIAGSWNSASSLGSGVWHSDSLHRMGISRRDTLGKSKALTQSELIQAGPLLIENSKPISGLESTKSSVRSVILWDGGTSWWLGCTSPCTLATLGNALESSSPANWKIRYALNLDGGRSSDFWVASSVPGGPFTRRMPWNRPVRNFLVLVKK